MSRRPLRLRLDRRSRFGRRVSSLPSCSTRPSRSSKSRCSHGMCARCARQVEYAFFSCLSLCSPAPRKPSVNHACPWVHIRRATVRLIQRWLAASMICSFDPLAPLRPLPDGRRLMVGSFRSAWVRVFQASILQHRSSTRTSKTDKSVYHALLEFSCHLNG